MGTDNPVFLGIIEWLDDTGTQIVQRIPAAGSGAIKYGAQLTVRESQAAVFFYQGKAVEAFAAGRHTLKTANIPLLTKLMSLPWGFESPLRAEVYFVNLKVFTDFKWGTRDPVAFKDSQLGLVRLRAHGVFNLAVRQPVLFINQLVGTQGVFTTEAVGNYLNQVIVSRLNDLLGETLDTLLDLPARYDELANALMTRLQKDFEAFGLALTQLYVNSITPPPEVQQAIDDRSRLGALDDMEKLMKMKAAMAIEKAAGGTGGGEGLGMGTSLGLMMPAMFSSCFKPGAETKEAPAAHCPECGKEVPVTAKFCPSCGHQQVIFSQCGGCGKNLPPHARFCPRCGQAAETKHAARMCQKCGTKNVPAAVFCNECGERL